MIEQLMGLGPQIDKTFSKIVEVIRSQKAFFVFFDGRWPLFYINSAPNTYIDTVW